MSHNNYYVCSSVTAGGDSSEAFEDVGHSQDARDLMEDYFVGDVHPVSDSILLLEGAFFIFFFFFLPSQTQG